MKKKTYLTPAIDVIHLKGRNLLISGSVDGVILEYDGEGNAGTEGLAHETDMEDDWE